MKTLLFGVNGQLGRDLLPRLTGDVIPVTRATADLTDHLAVRQLVEATRPQIIINCAAYNLVDLAEKDPAPAFAGNAWAVQNLARIATEFQARLVQYSTDYVFGLNSGRTTPYQEHDAVGPLSNYGYSKIVGEFAVRSLCPNSMIIRTCGLYGLHGVGGKGGNFVETMKRLGRERGVVRVVADQYCTPTFTSHVADATIHLLTGEATGIFHLTNSNSTTWHDFAAEIFRITQIPVELTAITSAEFNAPAKRPPYSVLSNAKYEQTTGKQLPPWQDAIAEYLQLKG